MNKERSIEAARSAKTVADRWRITTGYYVSDAGNRIIIRLTPAQAEELLDDVVRGRASQFFDDDTDGGAAA